MISICIPVYNFKVVPFVMELKALIHEDDLNTEIIVADDASGSDFKKDNEDLSSLSKVVYFELENNLGRSAIRNFLASKAKNDFLLFVDADSEISSKDFLKLYEEAIKSSKVICGGTSYAKEPKDENLMLRYVFGINREVRNVEDRKKFPYRSFSAHNFCIEKSLFLDHLFDEQIKSYGHEDTLLGFALKEEGVSIQHIDNTLVHIGLEPALEFITKTNTGLENLILLVNKNPDLSKLAEEVKVLRYFFKLKKMGLISAFSSIFNLSKKFLLKNLVSKNPSLLYFDIYKLGYLCNRAKDLHY